MSKETRTVSIDKENDQHLDQQDNASALVNDLLEQHRKGADRDTVALELQINQKERELRLAEDRVARLKEDLDELRELKQEFEMEQDAELEQAEAALSDVPADPDNPAVKNWATKLGMSPTELIETLGLE